ncbi:MAG: hypothetical protein ABFS05_05065 [Bacteroidota bacterium]
MFNRDSYWFGILIGSLMPLAVYAILYSAMLLYNRLCASPLNFDESLLQLISPVINLFLIRYYFVTKKYDDTGRGVLLVTFIFVIAYFVINRVVV